MLSSVIDEVFQKNFSTIIEWKLFWLFNENELGIFSLELTKKFTKQQRIRSMNSTFQALLVWECSKIVVINAMNITLPVTIVVMVIGLGSKFLSAFVPSGILL